MSRVGQEMTRTKTGKFVPAEVCWAGWAREREGISGCSKNDFKPRVMSPLQDPVATGK